MEIVVYGTTASTAFALIVASATLPGGLLFREAIVGSGFVIRAIAVSAIFAGSDAFIGDVAVADRESEPMGILSTVNGIGGVVGPLLLGGIATIAGYEFVVIGASLFAVAAAGFVAKGVAESCPGPTIHQLTAVGLSVMIERASRSVVLWPRFQRGYRPHGSRLRSCL